MVAEIHRIETAARIAMGNFEAPSDRMPTKAAARTAWLTGLIAALVALTVFVWALT